MADTSNLWQHGYWPTTNPEEPRQLIAALYAIRRQMQATHFRRARSAWAQSTPEGRFRAAIEVVGDFADDYFKSRPIENDQCEQSWKDHCNGDSIAFEKLRDLATPALILFFVVHGFHDEESNDDVIAQFWGSLFENSRESPRVAFTKFAVWVSYAMVFGSWTMNPDFWELDPKCLTPQKSVDPSEPIAALYHHGSAEIHKLLNEAEHLPKGNELREQVDALKLRFWEKPSKGRGKIDVMGYREIAKRTNDSPETARKRILAAMEILRSRILGHA